MGAAISLLLAIFSLTLPATPPTAAGSGGFSLRAALGLDALKLLRDANFRRFFVASVLICIPLAFYYQNASPFLTEIGTANATGKLTIGQISEVAFMLLLPVFLLRFGIKKTLLLGMLAWAVRYVLFAYGGQDNISALLIVGIALHGICYDFFFVSGQIYTDSKAGEHYRSAAQGMITLATYGVGMLIGFSVAGAVSDHLNVGGKHDWFGIWIYPAVFAAVVMVLFALLFRNEAISYETRGSVRERP
jgi:nucleoside transporter